MSSRNAGPVLCAGILALTMTLTMTLAPKAGRAASGPTIVVAQATSQPADRQPNGKVSGKVGSKNGVKKTKRDRATGVRGAPGPQPAPAGGVGPPDPGKYL